MSTPRHEKDQVQCLLEATSSVAPPALSNEYRSFFKWCGLFGSPVILSHDGGTGGNAPLHKRMEKLRVVKLSIIEGIVKLSTPCH